MDPYIHTAIATGVMFITYWVTKRRTEYKMIYAVAKNLSLVDEEINRSYFDGVRDGYKLSIKYIEKSGISDQKTLAQVVYAGALEEVQDLESESEFKKELEKNDER